MPTEMIIEDPLVAAIELRLDQLRVLAKSVGRTRDVELRKLSRLKPGTTVHAAVSEDYQLLDSVDAEIAQAISALVRQSSGT